MKALSDAMFVICMIEGMATYHHIETKEALILFFRFLQWAVMIQICEVVMWCFNLWRR